jgi:hypothetical protein
MANNNERLLFRLCMEGQDNALLCKGKMVRSPSSTLRGLVQDGALYGRMRCCARARWCALRAAPYGDWYKMVSTLRGLVQDGALCGRMHCCALRIEKMVRSASSTCRDWNITHPMQSRPDPPASRLPIQSHDPRRHKTGKRYHPRRGWRRRRPHSARRRAVPITVRARR